MNSKTAQKWDTKYAQATLNTQANPSFVLKEHSRLLPFNGQALELASGLGGNARFLAQCGLKTHDKEMNVVIVLLFSFSFAVFYTTKWMPKNSLEIVTDT